MAYERKRITLKEIPALFAFLDMCGHAYREGKGPFQVVQIQHPKGWGAICKNANDELSNDPEISEVITAFIAHRKGLKRQASRAKTKAQAQAPEALPAPAEEKSYAGLSHISAKTLNMRPTEFMNLLEDFAIELAPAMASAVLSQPDIHELPTGKAGDLAAELTYRLAAKMVAEHAKYRSREGL